MQRTLTAISLIVSLTFLLVLCGTPQQKAIQSDSGYQNLHPDVEYVGMATCRSCHNNIHETYIHTGMGQSWDVASPQKSKASFGDHALVYDDQNDLYYKPYFKGDSMFITEFRLEGADTIHQRTEHVSYIVGSGQHTNSHILDFNGYIYQAPITYYTQEEKWDMAPGYKGANLRFSRLLASECITCHNHLPEKVPGSLNKYETMPTGIGCERCHGPGSLHVKEKLAGNIVDTSQFIDYSIVNPRDLSADLQMDLCQRCHLQGVAVLEDEKSFYDFRPGMRLSSVFNVFLPRYTNSHEKFIMASQADRLRLSKCYTVSEELTCLNCHHPHHSIKVTPKEQYNSACRNCHQTKNQTHCSAAASQPIAQADCVSCHMPRSGSIDIPHVNITDHYITTPQVKKTETLAANEQAEIVSFLGLQMLTKDNPLPLDMARGYIALFDKYTNTNQMLDSAKYHLDRVQEKDLLFYKTTVHYYFARKAYPEIITTLQSTHLLTETKGWTAYRIGQAFANEGKHGLAENWYRKAIATFPYDLDFQEKLGISLAHQQKLTEAIKVFEFVLSENEKRPLALGNLGFVQALKGNFELAEQLYDRAIALDPDYVKSLLNKAALHQHLGKRASAKKLIKRVLKIQPENAQAVKFLKQL